MVLGYRLTTLLNVVKICPVARPSGHLLNTKAWTDVLNMRGLSLTEVAARSEVPRATLSSLLGGHHRAAVPMAHRIALAIDCDPVTLFPTLSALYQAVPAA